MKKMRDVKEWRWWWRWNWWKVKSHVNITLCLTWYIAKVEGKRSRKKVIDDDYGFLFILILHLSLSLSLSFSMVYQRFTWCSAGIELKNIKVKLNFWLSFDSWEQKNSSIGRKILQRKTSIPIFHVNQNVREKINSSYDRWNWISNLKK